MNFEHDLATLKQRIAHAERARDAWNATGRSEERYLEACSLVSALSLQLEMLCANQVEPPARLPSPTAGY